LDGDTSPACEKWTASSTQRLTMDRYTALILALADLIQAIADLLKVLPI
jgi:hypothetical protein